MNQTIEIIPWNATESSKCPVKWDTKVTVWYRGGGSNRDVACYFKWGKNALSTITHYAITPDEMFKPKRWRAGKDGLYFTVQISKGRAVVGPDDDVRNPIDNYRYERGIYFQTPEQAQQLADEINALIDQRANA